MDSIGKRVKELRDAKNLTQQDLATAAGVSIAYVRNLEQKPRRTQAPSLTHLEKVAGALGTTLGKLTGETATDVPVVSSGGGGVQLPFIGYVQAGGGIDEAADADETVSVSDVFRGASGVYRVRGKSMLGAHIREGDELVVKLDRDPPSGELVIAWRKDKGATVKRFYRDRHERYMRSESTADGEDEGVYTLGDGDRIVGVVLGIQRRYATAPPPKTKPPAKKKGK